MKRTTAVVLIQYPSSCYRRDGQRTGLFIWVCDRAR
jgi:hypothetical protein